MANYYAKYALLILSKADYQDGVGGSSVAADFPVVYGNQVLYDTVTGVEEPTGRHPDTGEPLWVLGYDRYTRSVTTDGVCGTSDGVAPPFGELPDVCSIRADVTAASVIADIDAAAKHVAYGVANVQPGAEPDDLPPALLPYYVDSIMPQAKLDECMAGLLARGVPQSKIDAFLAKHPEPTPRDLRNSFEKFVENITENP